MRPYSRSSEPSAQVELSDTTEPAASRGPAREEPSEQGSDAPRWGHTRRILFRFAFAYILLFSSTYLALYFLPLPGMLVQPYSELWNSLVTRVGDAVLHVDTSVLPGLSGDTTYNYVQVFCFLVLALAVTAIWTVLDRRRSNYVRLHQWLRVYVRFALAFWMLNYGLGKVIPIQFASPSLDRLLQPFGDASPHGLLWTFMGASAGYTIFTGLAETLGGLLLVARRTTLLGALVSIAVLANVVMLNFCYDVAVKLFSCHLLALALFLTLPDLGRLANLLVFNRKVEPAEIRPLFARKWLDRGALVLRSVFVFGLAALLLFQARQAKQSRDLATKPPLYGIWNVEEFVLDGQTRPPLLTDKARWQRVVFDDPRVMAILMGDSRQRFGLELNPGSRRLALMKDADPRWISELSYRRLDPHLLALEGTFDGHKIQARLRRIEEPEFPLLSKGFHWISEQPYIR